MAAELEGWLGEVRERPKATSLRRRMQSADRSARLSARLELFLHHHFVSRGYGIEWDPPTSTGKTPEFRAVGGEHTVVIEARLSGQETIIKQQMDLAEAIRPSIERLGLPHHLRVQFGQPCPPLSETTRVQDALIPEIVAKSESFTKSGREHVFERVHILLLGSQYEVHLQLDSLFPATVSVGAGGWLNTDGVLREDIGTKVLRYGRLDEPFVIAIWGTDFPGRTDEEWTLFGREAISWPVSSTGDVVGPTVFTRAEGGFFMEHRDGERVNDHVSAVVFYAFHIAPTPTHSLRVYHNPCATHPLPHDVFEGAYQCIPIEDEPDKGLMEWIPHEPKE